MRRCALSIFICLQFYWDFWIFRFMFSSNVGIDELGIFLEYFFCPLSLSPVLQWPICQATWHCSISHWGLFKSISNNKKFFNYFTLILVCLLQKTGHCHCYSLLLSQVTWWVTNSRKYGGIILFYALKVGNQCLTKRLVFLSYWLVFLLDSVTFSRAFYFSDIVVNTL